MLPSGSLRNQNTWGYRRLSRRVHRPAAGAIGRQDQGADRGGAPQQDPRSDPTANHRREQLRRLRRSQRERTSQPV
uniref:Uncharacterized protein n=1 Tax=Panagrellus redivivus TaxID=6233 RepID=A0A7E4ZRY4_PANRE